MLQYSWSLLSQSLWKQTWSLLESQLTKMISISRLHSTFLYIYKVYMCNKNQQDALFYYQFISIINLYTLKSRSVKTQQLLTYSMVQSPSWETNRFAASQEIPHISQNPKVHYRTHKRLSSVSILGQHNLVHIPTSHLLEIHPNIIHPSTPRSPQWSPSLRFP